MPEDAQAQVWKLPEFSEADVYHPRIKKAIEVVTRETRFADADQRKLAEKSQAKYKDFEEPNYESNVTTDSVSKIKEVTTLDVEEPTVVDKESFPTEEKVRISEGFKNSEFTAQTGLLTDAENYAQTIREGARLYAEQMHNEAEARFLEADRKFQEAENLRSKTQEDRDRILREARDEATQIKQEAYQDGFENGKKDGALARYEELEPQALQVVDLIEQLKRLRQIVRYQTEQEMVQMALLIAKKVIVQEIEVNADWLKDTVKNTLGVIEHLGKIRVFVNPVDYEMLQAAKAELEKYLDEEQVLVLSTSIDVEAGAVEFETDENVINYSFQKQFEDIEEMLSRKLADRSATLHEVDMEAYDFSNHPHQA